MWQKKGCWILLRIHLLILCIALISSGGIRGLKRDWSQAFLEMGERLGEEKPKVALTFDDGPHPVYTEEILDGLRKKGVKATFFVIGKSVEEQKEIIERMGEEGHLIGNHTYDHVNLGQLGKKEVCVQIDKTNKAVSDITGQEMVYMRPPFGEWNKNNDCLVDMIPVLWTVDTKDWLYQSPSYSMKQVREHVKDGSIILMHDYYKTSVEAAMEIVDYLLEEGYEFVTVDEIVLD